MEHLLNIRHITLFIFQSETSTKIFFFNFIFASISLKFTVLFVSEKHTIKVCLEKNESLPTVEENSQIAVNSQVADEDERKTIKEEPQTKR